MRLCFHKWKESTTKWIIDETPFQIETNVSYCPKCEKIVASPPYLSFNKLLSHEQQLKFFNLTPKQKE